MIEYELKNYEIDPIVETSNEEQAAAQGFFSILSPDLNESKFPRTFPDQDSNELNQKLTTREQNMKKVNRQMNVQQHQKYVTETPFDQ